MNRIQYSYTQIERGGGKMDYMPFIPVMLFYETKKVSVSGLLDTGSSVNVLPHEIGLKLGANWDEQRQLLPLGGNLAHWEARGLVVLAQVGEFSPVRLAFAWTETNDVPVILGQMNFFFEFEACFSRAKLLFDVRPKLKSR